MLTGQRQQFISQQPLIRQEPRMLAPPPSGSVMVRNVTNSFATPQRMPLHQVSSVPAPSPQVINVARPLASFPSQPAAQSQVYSGMPVGQGIPPRQQPVFASQPNFQNQNFIGQQQGVNIVRQVAGANMQPIYRNMEPLLQQQPSNQTSFLLPNQGSVQHSSQQPIILQRLPSTAGDRLPFDGHAVRTPMSLQSPLPGYMDFGGNAVNQLRFKSDFSSDPEIVGQPIETVIHNRKGQARVGDGRTTSGFGQNKPKNFSGVK